MKVHRVSGFESLMRLKNCSREVTKGVQPGMGDAGQRVLEDFEDCSPVIGNNRPKPVVLYASK